MLVKDIPYFVKFTFLDASRDDGCYSIADRETLKFVKHRASGESIGSLTIGNKIYFDGETDNLTFEITDICIQHIVDNLELLKYGIDGDDCTSISGNPKTWLFKILIRMKLIK
jgi:hypothetical protein